jgi:hypothetical protein
VLRIRDVYSGSRILFFYPSRIQNLGSHIYKQQQKGGVKKKIFVILYLWPQISQNLKLFYFEMLKKKNLVQFSKNYIITQKIVTKLRSQKYGLGDPGSEIRDPEKNIPYPGFQSRGQKGTGSRIRISNTAFLPT